MCGVAGLWDRRAGRSPGQLAAAASAMAEVLRHRGPDAGDVWCDADAGVALGHRRLSIVDLSPAGAQPMRSSCGRFVLSYNGEIYNADELRSELAALGRSFRGHSDTEVIVEGMAVWGVEATVKRLIGMFTLALWDRQERTLHLVRDRLGIKPMYWAAFGELFLFGSELKALRAHDGWRPEIDRDAVAAYLRTSYVPGPFTIYRGVRKLPPGAILSLRAGAAPEIRPYWTLEEAARAGQAARFSGSEAEAVDRLDALLGDAVRRRMVADVPLGAFLSGGIDSSTVVALMQAGSERPVRSFSIGFAEQDFDEAPQAAAVARHLGTDHTELYVSPEHAREVIPRLPDLYDEPFADPTQIPTFLVSEMTRRHVTVALSGDGGDELFAGYRRYFEARALFNRLAPLPPPARRAAAAVIGALPPAAWSALGRAVPGRWRQKQLGDKLHKFARVLEGDGNDFYRLVTSHWHDPEDIVLGGAKPRGILGDPSLKALVPDEVERLQYLDTLTYLPDDILTKVDRASMAASLEARVPLLDHRVVEFSWTLPPALKARDGSGGKWLLRQVLHRYVPPALVARPKMGFGVPIDGWLRGPLRAWAEELLAERRLAAEGILDPQPIRRRWQEHLSGTRNWQYALWNVLMLQAWKARWLP
jgi:asparagine synthase (glutamine-hydrolysing)